MKLNTKYILKKHLHRTMEKEKSTVLNVAAAGGGGGVRYTCSTRGLGVQYVVQVHGPEWSPLLLRHMTPPPFCKRHRTRWSIYSV